MRVRMKIQVSGVRNGEAWPARGERLEVSDDEGANLCASGLAEPVADDEAVDSRALSHGEERRPAPNGEVETRALTTDSAEAVVPNAAAETKPEAPAKKTAPARKAPAKKTAAPTPKE